MLLFKTKWIILKIHKVQEKDFLYTIFTEDYWKIMCQKKLTSREKSLDIGYLIHFEIETKEDRKVHKMRHIKILSEFSLSKKTYHEMESYLKLLAYAWKQAPDWVPVYQVLEIFEEVHNYTNITAEKLLLARLKLSSIFWNLPQEYGNEITKKILWFVHKNKISQILKLTGISEEIKKELESIF